MKLITILLAIALTGCGSLKINNVTWDDLYNDKSDNFDWSDLTPDEPSEPEAPPTQADDLPDGVTWLNVDISAWPVTATLNASVSGNALTLDSDKKNVWPNASMQAGDGSAMNATAVAFIQHDGKWYATAFEWMKTGQSVKSVSDSFKGTDGHMEPPLNSFKPQSGETYGFIVSAPSRNVQTIQERSNIVWVVWP